MSSQKEILGGDLNGPTSLFHHSGSFDTVENQSVTGFGGKLERVGAQMNMHRNEKP